MSVALYLSAEELDAYLHDAEICLSNLRMHDDDLLEINGKIEQARRRPFPRPFVMERFTFKLFLPGVKGFTISDPDDLGALSVMDISYDQSSGDLIMESNMVGSLVIECQPVTYRLERSSSPIAYRRFGRWIAAHSD
ncbi:MAG: hypothetical protein KDA95_04925 [Acidimicrobiales bacterium]|nr:hypothetical protein [Acidimicrobiales bacterium]